MRIEEKAFKVYAGERPRVLLLGNGLCRAFGGMSWNHLFDKIKDADKYPLDARRYVMPMPLKAVMLTGNNLATKMRGIAAAGPSGGPDDINWTSFTMSTPEMRKRLKELFPDFDYVLTTNYSYEAETALLDKPSLTPNDIAALMSYHEVENAQTKFLINTFNLAGKTQIWHIHGEARKPDSMIVGSYYYGRLLKRCIERLDGFGEPKKTNGKEAKKVDGKSQEFRKNINNGKPQKIGSWVDAFVLGDVYILGFGMDFSEADLWWLIEYKRNNAGICGKTVFMEPKVKTGNTCLVDSEKECANTSDYVGDRQCKSLLLESYGVETHDFDFVINSNEDYKVFYDKAISEIKSRNI